MRTKDQNARNNSPKQNFIYNESKDWLANAQRESIKVQNLEKLKKNNYSEERRESKGDISEYNFSLKIYDASNPIDRQSNSNHRSRNKNNGKIF